MLIDENIDLSGIPDEAGTVKEPDLSSIPDADFQNSKAEADSMLGEAWKTAQEVGNVYPMAEAAAHIFTSLYATPIAGLGGILASPLVAFGDHPATKVVETLSKWLIYQPQTEKGTRLSESALYPLKKLQQAGSAVADEIRDPYFATFVYTLIVGAPAWIGLRNLPKAVRTGFRDWAAKRPDMSVKERALVVQSLEDTIRKNPEMTEGEIVRRFENLRDEAMAKRAEGEKVVPIRKVEEPVTVYHGGAGVEALRKKFEVLTPEQKQKMPSSAIGLTGLSMTTDKAVAQKYSEAIGETKEVFESKINPNAKIKKVDTKGDGIDETFTNDDITALMKEGYDAIWDSSGEKEFRVLTDNALMPKPDLKPAETPETLSAKKFNVEMAEIVRKETDLTDAEMDVVFFGKEMESVTLYRGTRPTGKDARYYSSDKEWARQFTQSGLDSEIKTIIVPENEIYKATTLPEATSQSSLDAGIKEAKAKGFSALWVDEGAGQPNSVYMIDQKGIAITPKVEAKPISLDFKDHITSYLEYLKALVSEGEAGKRVRVTDLDGTEQWIGVRATYPEFMRDQGLTGEQVETALNKAIAGQKLTGNQEGIVRNALEQAQEMFLKDIDENIPDADFAAAEASIDRAIEQLFKKPEQLKATKEHLAKIRKALKPRKAKAAKKTIREATGQIKISKMVEGLTERTALADQIRFEVRAARDAYRAGKLEATITHRNKAISLYRRRERLRAIRDYLVIPENIMKKLTKGRDIGLMSDWEFKQYKDDLFVKAVELTEQLEAKNRLIKLISDKRLQRVENYQRALELPPIGEMTIKQLEEFEALLEPFADEDVFLTERELEVVDRTDLKGIRTWREARLALAKEVGATLEQIEAIKVGELDDYRYDTALAEQNPFYKMLVTESTRKLLEADARYYEIETRALALAKKAEKSRARTLIERAIPQDKKIMEYMEAPKELKPALAEELTPAQLDYAYFMEEYFGQALEYLIQTQALTKGRENYFVHMRRPFLEEVKESGLKKAFLSVYRNYIQDEAVFNILDEDTGNILPLEKFFQFALHRSGELLPTANITRAFTSYVKMFERKRSYDELIPKMDIYAQALTPQIFTPRGLEIDRSIKKFVNKYINSKKGRRIRWIGKQNGVIDLTIRAARTFTTVMDLGLNIPVSIASLIGEQATTLQGVGVKKYALGIKRLQTEQGKKIVQENMAFVGKSVFAELAEPGKLITERFMEGLFGLFRIATVTANKQFLLGSLTTQEFQSGQISSTRLAELKVDMGRWRKVTGAESLVGGTGAGGAAIQYKSWAVPILSTTLRDLKIFSKDMKAKGVNEALKSREAKELWRFFLMGSFVAIVGAMIAAEKDDRSFIGQMKAKAYRELNTLMQGIGPGLWLSVPRIMVFAKQFGANLQNILTLERYKTKPGLKGVEGLKRQLTPQVIRQLTREEKKKKRIL